MRSLQENYANNDRYMNNDVEVAALVNQDNERTDDVQAAIMASVQHVTEEDSSRTILRNMAGISDRDVSAHAEHIQRVEDQRAAHGMTEESSVPLNTYV